MEITTLIIPIFQATKSQEVNWKNLPGSWSLQAIIITQSKAQLSIW
jgi:hypothetical protein